MAESVNTVIAVLPLSGVIVGATVQYWFSRIAESKKQRQILATQSYVDYLKAVTEAAFGSITALANATDAKTRIVVFGSSSVITALAKFEKEGPVLDNSKSIASFLNIVAAMRVGTGHVSMDSIEVILLGPSLGASGPAPK